MDRFNNKVAIVTGGALGIGGAIARNFANEGAKVVIADINREESLKNRKKIIAEGGNCEVIVADVSKKKDIQKMINFTIDNYNRIDYLIQNAFGVSNPNSDFFGSAMDVSEKAWDEGMDLLTKSLFLGVKFASNELIKNKGSVVNIASVHGMVNMPNNLIYESGKTMVIGMTKQMACDFGPLGVRVNCICPGLILTESTESKFPKNSNERKFFNKQYPVRRTGKPDDIAKGVLFLCSDEASFITGHSLVIDGGLTIQIQEDLSIQLAKYAVDNPDIPSF
jgi:NAD(P)-dependent dehydrogenase (short-subunit alcohol dehydrogenase family)